MNVRSGDSRAINKKCPANVHALRNRKERDTYESEKRSENKTSPRIKDSVTRKVRYWMSIEIGRISA